MGKGFWIIIYDDYGIGLNLVNPRLYHEENGTNWWSYNTANDIEAHIKRMNLVEKYGEHFSVVDTVRE